ncbi:MAG: Txe/YoeB family addiction module toxin [Dysgonomonas sp.]|nr:Txe/YoeB family addiction module toxin [Dysgonomonas sp.]
MKSADNPIKNKLYTLVFTKNALEDIEAHKKAEKKPILRKIAKLLEELTEHPQTGTGKPGLLKYDLAECWSRRINDKHRLIYSIKDESIEVISAFTSGDYNDK